MPLIFFSFYTTTAGDLMPSTKPISPSENSPVYELFILALSLFALGSLAVQCSGGLSEETLTILFAADLGLCFFFLCDFLRSFFIAPNKLKYMSTWGWIDLVSAIPAIEPLRWGRAARVLRVLRVLRGLKAARIIGRAILSRRSESAFLAACLMSFLIIVFSSIAILHVEEGEQGVNITTAEDALWWSVVTITTVGYGDRFPVTTEGRLLGVILMFTGVGLFGTLSGFIAAWFLKPESGEERFSEIALLTAEVQMLREELRGERRRDAGMGVLVG